MADWDDFGASEALSVKHRAHHNTTMRWHGARITHSVQQSIPDVTVTTLNFDTTTFECSCHATWHDDSTNNSRLTHPSDLPTGLVIVEFQIALAYDADGSRRFGAVYKNGVAQDVVGHHHRSPGTTGSDMLGASAPSISSPGDYFTVVLLHDAGNALNTIQFDYNTHFSIRYVGKS